VTIRTLPALASSLQVALEKHAFSETTREVGGVLIGRLHDQGATVTAFIPALKATGSATHVTFTHEVWSDVLDTVERDHVTEQIVGWYHTHPSFGLFLSQYDLFIHRNFFPDERMLALVIDPIAGELGWFGWEADEIEELERGKTARAAIPHAVDTAASQVSTRNRRGRSGLILAGCMLVVAGAAFAWGSAGGGREEDLVKAAERISDQQEVIAGQDQEIRALQDAALPPTPEPSPGPASPSRHLPRASLITVVQPGDSWWALAERFFADGTRYPELVRANPRRSGLDPGDRVVIPGAELTTQR
jgi:proteasome lid subunit RPN8/RPN11